MNVGDERTPPAQGTSISFAWPLVGLVVLAAVAVVAYAASRAPAVVSADAPAERFSAERAWSHLEALVGDGVPHPLGSAQNAVVRNRIIERLTAAGYEPQVQPTETPVVRPTEEGFERRAVGLHNVMARRPGTGDGKAVLIASHYDSVARSPGASDDGVGVAVMLEIAERLGDIEPLRNDVIFLITDGEEYGLRGARAFVEEHPWLEDVAVVVNLEARGSSGPSLMFQTGANSAWLVNAFSGARRPITGSLFDEAYQRLPNDTDFTVFMEHGLTGCNFAFIGDVQHYHTPEDNLENASPTSLQHHGENAWHLVRTLGAADLRTLPTGDAVYFDVLGLTIVRWPEPATWLLVGLAALLLFVTWRRWRSAVRAPRVFVAALVVPVVLAATALVGEGVVRAVGSAGGWPDDGMSVPLLAIAVVWPAALAAVTVVTAMTSRIARPEEVCLGMFVFVALLGIAATWLVIGTTYLFVVPLLVALACACAGASFRPWIGLASIVAVGVVWLPLEYHLLDAFGWRAGGVLAVRAGIVMLPLLPLLAAATRRSQWTFAASAAVVTLVAGALSCVWQGSAS